MVVWAVRITENSKEGKQMSCEFHFIWELIPVQPSFFLRGLEQDLVAKESSLKDENEHINASSTTYHGTFCSKMSVLPHLLFLSLKYPYNVTAPCISISRGTLLNLTDFFFKPSTSMFSLPGNHSVGTGCIAHLCINTMFDIQMRPCCIYSSATCFFSH